MIGLRNVDGGDLDAYIRMRTDPTMMSHLGGPRDAAQLPQKLARDVDATAADREWILMILGDDADPTTVAGTVTVWSHADAAGGQPISEIGWMVLPEFQGRHVASSAVGQVLQRAVDDGRWGPIHAFPSVANEPSNRLCRRLGFALLGEEEMPYRGQLMRTNHWVFGGATPGPAGQPGDRTEVDT